MEINKYWLLETIFGPSNWKKIYWKLISREEIEPSKFVQDIMSEVRIANLNTRVKSNYILSLSYSFSSLIFLCCPNLDISICRYLIIPCYIYLKRHLQRYPFKYPLYYLRHFRALLEYAGVVWCLRLVRNQNLLYIIRPRLQFANFQHLRMSIMRGPDSDF